MNSIDLILNIAALLLWLNWRSIRFDPLVATAPATLAGTLRRTEPRRWKGWQLLAGLIAVLLFRALLYSQVGAAVDWTPKINLFFVVLPFRIDLFSVASLYSMVSFLRVLLIFYFWLLTLALINHGVEKPDPLLKLIRLQLGPVGRWPWLIQALLPLVATICLWALAHPFLVRAFVVGHVQSYVQLAEQGLLVGLALILTLKYLLPLFLLFHLVLTYVYLGRNPLWDFISTTAGQLLRPFRAFPLRFGKLDLAPLVAALVILFVLEVVPIYTLHRLFELKRAAWPQ